MPSPDHLRLALAFLPTEFLFDLPAAPALLPERRKRVAFRAKEREWGIVWHDYWQYVRLQSYAPTYLALEYQRIQREFVALRIAVEGR